MAHLPNQANINPKASSVDSKVIPKPNLGQYVFTEKLGSGTYATVYKAYRKSGVREVVAIKCVLKNSLNKASTENLLTEIELLKNLKHEHIVSLKDFQWDSNYIYLIMEFCSGGDLSKFIRSRRALPEHVVKRFLQQIASAMKFLWDNNVAHMDLKPQNILLTSTTAPQIKLADFGFAKHLYDGDSLHVMRGSPLYMAPEIICRGTFDNRVDLWSIGVILFECLFGKPPFASGSFKELGQKIWDQKPVEIPPGVSVSDKARDLTHRLLQRDPATRITFEEFFAHPFVDMEHIPSKDSLPMAIQTAAKAVELDGKGDFKGAVRLYCEALEFFMPAIHYEKSHQRKEALRAKVKQYIDRAETLKQQAKSQISSSAKSKSCTAPPLPPRPSNPGRPNLSSSPAEKLTTKTEDVRKISKTTDTHKDSGTSNKTVPEDVELVQGRMDEACSMSPSNELVGLDSSPNSSGLSSCQHSPTSHSEASPQYIRSVSNEALEDLMLQCSDSQELVAALKLIIAAVREEQEESYSASLKHYEIALGAVLKLLPDEPKGHRKDLLVSQVKLWMAKAEQIKLYLEIKSMNLKDTSLEEEESESSFLSQSKQCCIQ